MNNQFEAATDLLEGAAFAIRGHAKDRAKAEKDCREIANACIVLEAAAKVDHDELQWALGFLKNTYARSVYALLAILSDDKEPR
jgi:hypothetical protein